MANTPNRNDACHCGSGKKYKNCCLGKDQSGNKSKFAMIVIGLAVIASLFILLLSITSGSGPIDCPPGTVWSDAHNHCH
ncbi:MAG: SEC-C metal-binding domain-containing protein [Balneolaceae bacterium]